MTQHASPFDDRTPGAKWWRVDFHTHTPHSWDAYRTVKSKAGAPTITEQEWLLAHMAAGLDAVVVTDHNGGGWIDSLKNEYKSLAAAKPQGFRPLAIFPAVEITTAQNVHLLVVCETTKGSSDIARILQLARYTGEQGDHCCAGDSTVAAIVEDIQAQGVDSVVIPAHVNGAKGLLGKDVPFDTRKKALNHPLIYALECAHSKQPDWIFTDYAVGKKSFATVFGSDSHERAEIGRRTTWVRMAEPTLEGLRVALLDGAPSVLPFVAGEKPGPDANCRICGITISGTRHLGRMQPERIDFNPSLNAIIGGRGTGKSSILELIRKTAKRGEALRRTDATIHEAFESLLREITDDPTQKPVVELDCELHGQVFRLRWSKADGYALSERQPDGSFSPAPGAGEAWETRFPLRIFSQKQLYAFKKQTAALLDEVDAAPQLGISEWKRDWERSTGELVQVRGKFAALDSELRQRSNLQAQLDDKLREIRVLEDAGHKAVLQQLALRRRQRGELDKWDENSQPLTALIEETAARFALPTLALTQGSPTGAEETKLAAASEKFRVELEKEAAVLRAASQRIETARAAWLAERALTGWQRLNDESEGAYRQLIDSLVGKTSVRPEQYGQLVQQEQVLKKQIEKLDALATEKGTLSQRADALLADIKTSRVQLSTKRSDFLGKLFNTESNLKATLKPRGDISGGISSLRSILGREQGVSDAEFENIAAYLSGANDTADLDVRVGSVKSALLHANRTGEIPTDATGLDWRRPFLGHIKTRSTEDMSRVLLWFPPDDLDLRYRQGSSGKFKPLKDASPGQVAAAVLAFILAQGDEPLILDQPEDDLDNQLIYDLIVRELRANKQRRQVIVVTHNPNIVVNGNADLVIPLHNQNDQTDIPVRGALQDAKVREWVCDIMEGGREALERRFRCIIHD
jgi:predicted metal-dependent phosphoesterase TrpH